MNKKKLLLILSSGALAIGGLFSLALINEQNNYEKTSADSSATFLADFSTQSEVSEGVYDLEMKKVGSDTSSVPLRAVGVTSTSTSFGNTTDFYFTNLEPFRGMSYLAMELSSSSYSYYAATYLSYNPLTIEDIYSGKYQDLYVSMVQGYGKQTFTLESTSIPSLVNYRYVLTHVMRGSGSSSIEDSPVLVTNLGIITPCAAEPTSISVGTNTGVLSQEVKDYISSSTNSSVTVPNEVGNGAYYTDPSTSYFRFNNCVNPDAECQFLNSITTGFTLTYEAEMYGMKQDIYQKKTADKTHSILAQIYKGIYGDYYQLSYDDSIEYINKSKNWPTNVINETFSSTYANLVLPFTSSLIKEYVTTSTEHYDFDNNLMIMISLNEGHTSSELASDLAALKEAYVSEGFEVESAVVDPIQASYSLKYDGKLFSVQFFANLNQPMVQFLIGEYVPKPFPTAAKIIEKLGITSSLDKVIPYSGNGGFTWKEISSGPSPVGTTSFNVLGFNVIKEEVKAYVDTLQAAGFELKYENTSSNNQKDYSLVYTIDEIYNSQLSVSVTYYEDQTATFYYSFSDHIESIDDYAALINYLGFDPSHPFATDVETSSSYAYGYLNPQGPVMNPRGFVYGAGDEFITSFTSIDGLIYDYITDSYHLPYEYMGIRLIKIDEGVVLIPVYAEFFGYDLQPFTVFNETVNQFISDYSLSSENAISLAATDNIPAYFYLSGANHITYYGSEEKVNELKTLLASKLSAKSIFRYSEYLDSYINESDSGFAYSFEITKTTNYSELSISLETGKVFSDYSSYNDLSLGTNVLLAAFPDIIENKDSKEFILDQSSSNFLRLISKHDYSDYNEKLIAAGFIKFYGDSYMKVDPSTGYVYNASVTKNGNNWVLQFNQGGQFYDASYLNQEGNEEMKAFFNQFGVPQNFTSTSKVYHYEFSGSSGMMYIFGNLDEPEDYKNYLLSNGYTFVQESNYYAKLNPSGDAYYSVSINTQSSFTTIQFTYEEFGFVSYSAMVEQLATNSHYASRNALHLVYPIDDGENHYAVKTNTSRETEIMLSNQYDMASYETAIIAHDEYESTTTPYNPSGSTVKVFNFTYGKITVTNVANLAYRVELYCSYRSPEGQSFDTAIVASLGNNAAEIDSKDLYYIFTAPNDGEFIFESESEYDTYGTLYNSLREEINSDDDSGSGNNFKMTQSLKAGDVVYISMRMYSSDQEGEGYLKISQKVYPTPETSTEIVYGDNEATLSLEESFFTFTPMFSAEYRFYFGDFDYVDYIIYDSSLNIVDEGIETSAINVGLNGGETYYFSFVLNKKGYSSYTATFTFTCEDSVPTVISGSLIEGINTVSINEQFTWFEFTPTSTGYYDIYSQASEGDPLDTYGSVFDSTGELYADDDSGDNNNFLMSGVLLEEGVTYYIGARLYTGEGNVNYNIVIQLVS